MSSISWREERGFPRPAGSSSWLARMLCVCGTVLSAVVLCHMRSTRVKKMRKITARGLTSWLLSAEMTLLFPLSLSSPLQKPFRGR